ncbi:MAG: YibE/F family protein [bacterium]
MKKFLLVVAVLFGLIVLFSPSAGATQPERGNYVPSDLDIRTHPFVEHFVYGGKFFRGALYERSSDGWEVAVNFSGEKKIVKIPGERISLDKELQTAGQSVLVKQTPDDRLLISNLDRSWRYLLLFGICVLICLLVGGKVTARGLFSVFAGSLFFIFWTVPRIQGGSWIMLEISLFYLLVSLLVLPGSLGFNRRALSAILTALATGIISLVFLTGVSHLFRVTGLFSDVFQTLDYAMRYFPGQIAQINLNNLIIGATLIGALGVILDVSIDVTSSTAEIATSRPDLNFTELLKRSLTVSRRLVGTMTNTLLLAYAGANLYLLLNFYLLPTPTWVSLNRDLVAVEVIRALGGALGFLTAMPIAVGFYALICRDKSGKPAPPD